MMACKSSRLRRDLELMFCIPIRTVGHHRILPSILSLNERTDHHNDSTALDRRLEWGPDGSRPLRRIANVWSGEADGTDAVPCQEVYWRSVNKGGVEYKVGFSSQRS